VTDGQVKILDGNTFAVSDKAGDMEATSTDPSGLFALDTRFLSTWRLTLDGKRLTPLSVDDLQYFEAKFFLVPDTGTVYSDSEISVIRQRTLDSGMCERLTVLNHAGSEADLSLRLDVDSDFADIFEVKDALEKTGSYDRRVEDGRLVIEYRRDSFRRLLVVSSSAPAMVDEGGLTFAVHLPPGDRWSTVLHVGTVTPNRYVEQPLSTTARGSDGRDLREDLDRWIAAAPRLECDDPHLQRTYLRSLIDLAALRFSPAIAGEDSLPAAGLPWFMSMFGRDSILTSLQALPFAPDQAATTIRVLAAWQGSRSDDFRDEDPGKIVHELRYGEMSAFEHRPQSPYYGDADGTPLFVVLLDEYELWSGDADLVRDYEYEARAALDWIGRYGDMMGNGYISYRPRREDTGLANQCWKDSWNSICYRDGRLPGFPRATCELQGYAYDAMTRGARLAREFWNDPEYAQRLERNAADLKERFNRDYWIDDGGYYALALDGAADGAQVDALSSNIGHLLWSGIVPDERAEAVVGHLMGPRLYSGWGVRTLAVGEERYNPIGYHVGTVWPFDNSFIAWGLRRYGYKQEAAQIASDMLDAAAYFDGRLPEAFGGYDRTETRYPVQYPTACSPQAWSTGAPLLFLRTMLGLQPSGQHLVVEPALPSSLGSMTLLDIPGRWGRLDAFGRGLLGVDREHLEPAPARRD
jgi:glycogen debranching enzyme